MTELKNIFKNNNEQINISIEMRDEIRALTDIVDHFKSMATSTQESIKNVITKTNENIKEIYNANWFIHTENSDKLKCINDSIDNLGKINNEFVEQSQADKDKPDYLKEQYEQKKMFQSQITNNLLGELLKEVKKNKISARVDRVDRDNGRLFGGVSTGLMGMLGLGVISKTGFGISGTKGLTKLLKIIPKGFGKGGIIGTGVMALDEMMGFGVGDKLFGYLDKIEEEFLSWTPGSKLRKKTNEYLSDLFGFEDDNSVIGKSKRSLEFFKNNDPMSLIEQLYTDEKAFKNSLSEFSGIWLGNTLDTVDKTKEEIEKQSQQKKKEKIQTIQNEKKLDTQYQPSENELKPTPEIDRQLADYLLNKEEKERSNENGKKIDAPPRTNEFNLDEAIKEISNDLGIEPSLFKAMIQTESNFNPNAVSEDNAYGLGQVREIAAKDVGADWERVKTDPYYNLQTSGKYLKKQLDAFGGDKRLALSAYNAGPTATRRAGGVAQNAETKAYVDKTLATQELYKAREEMVKANKEKERTTQLRNMSITEKTSQQSESNNTFINAPNNTSVQNEDDSLTRINSSSPFDLTYAKLLFNPNYNVV